MSAARRRTLADADAIRDLARRYAHHVWQNELEALAGLFTEDGEMDPGIAPADSRPRARSTRAFATC